MDAEKRYKWFAMLQVLIAGVYLFLFFKTEHPKSPLWNYFGMLFLPFSVVSLGFGILGIALIFKARKEHRDFAGLIAATIGHFSGAILFLVMIVFFVLALFNIIVFQSWLSGQ